ncbi:uncharacterized protein LOC116161112 [Photinus pyralis]|uniref:uncharacterized protein LOC116161112 n=1 Tax=Photinus pyralis TaxID=7054 RepID=UPI001267095F|nr:uncharacterized protein LOC116161112 [Photinus pyralis]
MPNDQLDTMDNANTQRDPEETREESNNDESIVDEPTTVEDEPPESTNTTMASTTATAVSTSTATVPTSNMYQGRKRQRRNDAADTAQNQMLIDAYSILKKTSATPTDHYETFGMHVASELRKYDSNTLPHVKRAILDVLFRADIGEFTPNHNVRNTSGYYNSNFTTPTSSRDSYPPTPTPSNSQCILVQDLDSRPPQQEDTLVTYLTNINPEILNPEEM